MEAGFREVSLDAVNLVTYEREWSEKARLSLAVGPRVITRPGAKIVAAAPTDVSRPSSSDTPRSPSISVSPSINKRASDDPE